MRPRRRLVVLGWVLSVLVAAGVGFLAARATFVPPQVEVDSQEAAHYTVSEGTVGRSVELPVRVTWHSVASGRVGSSGTVTALEVTTGDLVQPGSLVAEVDLRPMVVMPGDTPAFRDLGLADQGADVRQLEEFLHESGHLDRAPGAAFDETTQDAVRGWQESAGYPVDGTVRAGDIVFVQDLPARVRVPDHIEVGARISAGDVVLEVLAAEPVVQIELSGDQAPLVPSSGPVTVAYGDHEWDGQITSAGVRDDGGHYLSIEAPAGGPVCGADCQDLPATGGSTMVVGRIVAVEEHTGPLVPSAAVRTRPAGTAFVVRQDGTELDVELLAIDRGRAVVSGIEPGEVIRLFGTGPGGTP